jgi:hypothetical protein
MPGTPASGETPPDGPAPHRHVHLGGLPARVPGRVAGLVLRPRRLCPCRPNVLRRALPRASQGALQRAYVRSIEKTEISSCSLCALSVDSPSPAALRCCGAAEGTTGRMLRRA